MENTKTAPKKANDNGMLSGANQVNAMQDKKEALNALVEKFKPEPPKSAEERISKMKQFEALSNRYKTLKEKDEELKTFHAGNDKTGAKITFQNAQGFRHEVQNSNVIDRLTQAAKEELSILLAEAENEILTFII
jgi:alanyl-tRNA synthetase